VLAPKCNLIRFSTHFQEDSLTVGCKLIRAERMRVPNQLPAFGNLGARKLVAMLVVGMPGLALEPLPLDFVASAEFQGVRIVLTPRCRREE